MSITAPPDLDHPVLTALVAVVDAVTPVNTPGAVEWWRFTDKERLAVVTRMLEVSASVDAMVLQAIGHLDRDGVTEREGCFRTANWLGATNHLSLGAARREVAAGRALTGRFTATADALATGTVSAEQAQAIVRALDELPPELSDEQVQAGEATMLGYAQTLGPRELETLSRRLLDVLCPEIAEAKDAERLERQEKEAARTRFLRFFNDGHGATYGRFKLGIGDGEAVRAVIDAIAHRDRVGDDITSSHGDMRTMEQRRADALVEMTGAYLAEGNGPANGGDRPRVNLLLDYKTLLDGLAPATMLDSGDQLSAQQARLLACDADILPIVCNGSSQPLDIGRQQRLFTGALRQALAVRDHGCTFPGCDRPPRDCDAHHIVPWWHHGETALNNGALLCRFHHQQVEPKDRHGIQEHQQWMMRMRLDGYPDVIPPTWVDPLQQPRRHERFPPANSLERDPVLTDVTYPTPVTDDEPRHSPGAIQQPCSVAAKRPTRNVRAPRPDR